LAGKNQAGRTDAAAAAANQKKETEAPSVNGADTGAKPAGETTPGSGPQITSLVSKFIELADAGVGLGINVVSLLTAFATKQASGAAASMAQQAAAPPSVPASAPEGPVAEARGAPGGPSRNYCIVNRLPVRAGEAAKISFSINNDTADTSKNLRLSCTGFLGAAAGFAIPEGTFTVEPSSAAIGPMDFERFVLKGELPAGAPADSYNGWILVAGDEELRIPAVLMVS
jgi:hypothetical protein